MRIAVAGGDLRMLTVADMLESFGHECRRITLGCNSLPIKEALHKAEAVILPLPCIKDGYLFTPMSNKRLHIDEIFSLCNSKTLFLGGGMPFADDMHVDYATREEFKLKNAVPTAEGAIAIAVTNTDFALNGANALVVGYGRIGCYLAEILKGINCHVSVIARRSQSRTLAEMSGFTAYAPEEVSAYSSADVIFNTVPHTVIGGKELASLKKGTKIIDLASMPGGVDRACAEKHDIEVISALALPGKYSPVTAGRIIFETVISIFRERGMCV